MVLSGQVDLGGLLCSLCTCRSTLGIVRLTDHDMDSCLTPENGPQLLGPFVHVRNVCERGGMNEIDRSVGIRGSFQGLQTKVLDTLRKRSEAEWRQDLAEMNRCLGDRRAT